MSSKRIRKTTHLIVQSHSNHIYIISSICSREDTQILSIEPILGKIRYFGIEGYDLFTNEKAALEALRNRGIKEKTHVRCKALIGFCIMGKFGHLLVVLSAKTSLRLHGGNRIKTIEKSHWIRIPLHFLPLNNTTFPKTNNLIHQFPINNFHYYCETLDITRPYPSDYPIGECRNDFCWNNWLAIPFTKLGLRRWCVVLLQGCALTKDLLTVKNGQAHISSNRKQKLKICVITRRSNLNTGTKYYAGGVNSKFEPGNESETELIIFQQIPEKKTFWWYSMIFRIGNVPTNWKYRIKTINQKIKKKIRINRSPYKGTTEYYKKLFSSNFIKTLNCLSFFPKKKSKNENKLFESFQNSIKSFQNIVDLDFNFHNFDWNGQINNENYSSGITNFWKAIKPFLSKTKLNSGFLTKTKIRKLELEKSHKNFKFENKKNFLNCTPNNLNFIFNVKTRQDKLFRLTITKKPLQTNTSMHFISQQIVAEICRKISIGLLNYGDLQKEMNNYQEEDKNKEDVDEDVDEDEDENENENEDEDEEKQNQGQNLKQKESWNLLHLKFSKFTEILDFQIQKALAELFYINGRIQSILFTNKFENGDQVLKNYLKKFGGISVKTYPILSKLYSISINDKLKYKLSQIFLGINKSKNQNNNKGKSKSKSKSKSKNSKKKNSNIELVSDFPSSLLRSIPCKKVITRSENHRQKIQILPKLPLLLNDPEIKWIVPKHCTKVSVVILLNQPCIVSEICLTVRHELEYGHYPDFMDLSVGNTIDELQTIYYNEKIPFCADGTKLWYSFQKNQKNLFEKFINDNDLDNINNNLDGNNVNDTNDDDDDYDSDHVREKYQDNKKNKHNNNKEPKKIIKNNIYRFRPCPKTISRIVWLNFYGKSLIDFKKNIDHHLILGKIDVFGKVKEKNNHKANIQNKFQKKKNLHKIHDLFNLILPKEIKKTSHIKNFWKSERTFKSFQKNNFYFFTKFQNMNQFFKKNNIMNIFQKKKNFFENNNNLLLKKNIFQIENNHNENNPNDNNNSIYINSNQDQKLEENNKSKNQDKKAIKINKINKSLNRLLIKHQDPIDAILKFKSNYKNNKERLFEEYLSHLQSLMTFENITTNNITFFQSLLLELLRLKFSISQSERDRILIQHNYNPYDFNPERFLYFRDEKTLIELVNREKSKTKKLNCSNENCITNNSKAKNKNTTAFIPNPISINNDEKDNNIQVNNIVNHNKIDFTKNNKCLYCLKNYCSNCIKKKKKLINLYNWEEQKNVCRNCSKILKSEKRILKYLNEISKNLKIENKELKYSTKKYQKLLKLISSSNNSISLKQYLHNCKNEHKNIPNYLILNNVPTSIYSPPINNISISNNNNNNNNNLNIWFAPKGLKKLEILISLLKKSDVTSITLFVDYWGYNKKDYPIITCNAGDTLTKLIPVAKWNLLKEYKKQKKRKFKIDQNSIIQKEMNNINNNNRIGKNISKNENDNNNLSDVSGNNIKETVDGEFEDRDEETFNRNTDDDDDDDDDDDNNNGYLTKKNQKTQKIPPESQITLLFPKKITCQILSFIITLPKKHNQKNINNNNKKKKNKKRNNKSIKKINHHKNKQINDKRKKIKKHIPKLIHLGKLIINTTSIANSKYLYKEMVRNNSPKRISNKNKKSQKENLVKKKIIWIKKMKYDPISRILQLYLPKTLISGLSYTVIQNHNHPNSQPKKLVISVIITNSKGKPINHQLCGIFIIPKVVHGTKLYFDFNKLWCVNKVIIEYISNYRGILVPGNVSLY
ncbi:phosphoinositide phosphatase sac9-related [Anaeramoeba flamelloides]|uniref:Phosphoinositide phosphatase sac9-related n=1 Tax=Anaeramoeba flamelloides TaxID=1746091 RepID=A0ABQ8YNE4_9EUKA|nr:phosphoinositide phosphatase sac9-related [Anaeramoeba flamelloides]